MQDWERPRASIPMGVLQMPCCLVNLCFREVSISEGVVPARRERVVCACASWDLKMCPY